MTPAKRTPPGFRFSWFDAAVLAAAAVGSWFLYRGGHPVWWMLPLVVSHFFLFCNVLRMRRSYELTWAAALVAISAVQTARGDLSASTILPWVLPVTALLAILEIRSPRYHGIFALRKENSIASKT